MKSNLRPGIKFILITSLVIWGFPLYVLCALHVVKGHSMLNFEHREHGILPVLSGKWVDMDNILSLSNKLSPHRFQAVTANK